MVLNLIKRKKTNVCFLEEVAKEIKELVEKRFFESYLDESFYYDRNKFNSKQSYESLVDYFLKSDKSNWVQLIDTISKLDYKIFLKTPFWQIISAYKKDILNKRCQICNSESNLHVHHSSYFNHGNIEFSHNLFKKNQIYDMDSLITVCERCHSLIHNNIEIK